MPLIAAMVFMQLMYADLLTYGILRGIFSSVERCRYQLSSVMHVDKLVSSDCWPLTVLAEYRYRRRCKCCDSRFQFSCA